LNKFDLQIQTTASDGKHTPSEVVKMAAEQGLQIISITDHDTVDGLEEALRAGGEWGVRVIPGIEISVKDNGAHILGFGIDRKNPEILRYSAQAKEQRIEGAKKMTDNLKGAGFVIEWQDVEREALGWVVARPHLAKAVLGRPENKERLGGVSTPHDFIEKFLSNESPYYVKRESISAQDAIFLIHKAGGVAVWSHPAIHFRSSTQTADKSTPISYRSLQYGAGEAAAEMGRAGADYEALEKFLKELMAWGIDGVEVFTPSHSEDDVEVLLGLAAKYNLLKTAGSDFHEKGQEKKASPTVRGVQMLRSATYVGDYPTYGFSTEDIIRSLDEAINKSSRLYREVSVSDVKNEEG